MKSRKFKFVIRLTAVLLSAIAVFLISDSIFSSANDRETSSIEVCKTGVVVPAAVRNFEMNLKDSGGAEQLKHYDIKGKGENSNIFGYVQIWESENSLAHYLKISKEYMSSNVFGFHEGEITVNGITWKKWEYIVNSIAVAQGFYEKDNKIYFCSLCVPYKEKNYAFDKIFIELLESVV
ncbi:MAG: hypothetical protein E7387_07955 [Ruminococcaceae bacterium]|nr:hypothetical protein [Oscillospiraceae bacterium]